MLEPNKQTEIISQSILVCKNTYEIGFRGSSMHSARLKEGKNYFIFYLPFHTNKYAPLFLFKQFDLPSIKYTESSSESNDGEEEDESSEEDDENCTIF